MGCFNANPQLRRSIIAVSDVNGLEYENEVGRYIAEIRKTRRAVLTRRILAQLHPPTHLRFAQYVCKAKPATFKRRKTTSPLIFTF